MTAQHLDPGFVEAYANFLGVSQTEAAALLQMEPLEEVGFGAAAFVEEEHPRHPPGSPEGGRFRPKLAEGPIMAKLGDPVSIGMPRREVEERSYDEIQLSTRDPNWSDGWLRPIGFQYQSGAIDQHVDAVARSDAAWAGEPVPSDPEQTSTQGVRDMLDHALEMNDMTLPEYQAAVEQELKNHVAGLPVAIRTPVGAIDSILADGRFKTQFETGSSSGAYSPHSRRAQERGFWGYGLDTPEELRPIYGYIDDEATYERHSIENYGEVGWQLKPEVRNRTTIAAIDTLSRPVIPTPVNNPSWRSVPPPGYEDTGMWGIGEYHDPLTWGFENTDYIEAQVHGGVTLDDVESVTLPADWEHDEVWVHGRYGQDSRLDVADLRSRLEKRGITVRFRDY